MPEKQWSAFGAATFFFGGKRMEHLVARKNRPFSLSAWLRREREETAVLLRCIPATAVTLFVVSVICMNLLANKTHVRHTEKHHGNQPQ